MNHDLTEGSIVKGMLRFSVPYLVSCFLQTFYGMADMFITGHFRGADSITAVHIGSQLMHMLTVVIVGLAMGTTVAIGRGVGAKDQKKISGSIGNSITIFLIFSACLTAILLALVQPVLTVLSTPKEAIPEARAYLLICFAGIPFITAYNVLSSIFRGLGDTRKPMIFVGIAGVINVLGDWLLIGPAGMGAAGAAIATVASQGISVLLAIAAIRHMDTGIRLGMSDLKPDRATSGKILSVGVPIACQDGLIQVSFLAITAIANSRGLEMAAAVGIVEKIISFLFLVPSAMLSTVSALAAQNAGAGRHERGKAVLRYGITMCIGFGTAVFALCLFLSPGIVSLFVQKGEAEVIRYGGQYLRTYSLDCIFAGIHFCFSGYFSAYGKSLYSFFHNIVSILSIRIPGAWLAALLFPTTLGPMGLAAPLGSALSAAICFFLYRRGERFWQ